MIRILLSLIALTFTCQTFAQSPGPGVPVRSETHEILLNSFFRKISNDSADLSIFSDKLFFGPALLQQFSNDAIISKMGTPINITTSSGKMKSVLFHDAEVSKLFSSKNFLTLLKIFANGKARMANQKERDIYYSLISYEIEGNPVTVFDNGQYVLLFDFAYDHIFHMDLISSYSKN